MTSIESASSCSRGFAPSDVRSGRRSGTVDLRDALRRTPAARAPRRCSPSTMRARCAICSTVSRLTQVHLGRSHDHRRTRNPRSESRSSPLRDLRADHQAPVRSASRPRTTSIHARARCLAGGHGTAYTTGTRSAATARAGRRNRHEDPGTVLDEHQDLLARRPICFEHQARGWGSWPAPRPGGAVIRRSASEHRPRTCEKPATRASGARIPALARHRAGHRASSEVVNASGSKSPRAQCQASGAPTRLGPQGTPQRTGPRDQWQGRRSRSSAAAWTRSMNRASEPRRSSRGGHGKRPAISSSDSGSTSAGTGGWLRAPSRSRRTRNASATTRSGLQRRTAPMPSRR
jgi:hypothetical protein